MRLLYVGMRWDYGDFVRGESFEHWNFYHSLRTYCIQRGWTFRYYDFMERARTVGRSAMTEELRELCGEFKPDLLFSALFDATHDPHLSVFRDISDLGTITINWFCDDHWRYDGYSRHVAPYFDRICTTATSALPKYQADGMGHKVIKSQWACNHELYRPNGHPRDLDVSFVGMNHGNRAEVLERLHQEGLDVAVFGHGWPDRPRVDFGAMIQVFNRSRINLNLSNSSVMTGQQIKGRNFEVPGCGAFLLTGTAENLEDYFQDGKETVIYRDEAELPELVRYYVTHESERNRIAEAGYERVMAEHTWHHRYDAIFREVLGRSEGQRGPLKATRRCAVMLAESVVRPHGTYLTASGLASELRASNLSLSLLTFGKDAPSLQGGIVHRGSSAADLMNLSQATQQPDVFCAVSSWDLFRMAGLPKTTLKVAIVTDELPDSPTLEALDLVLCPSHQIAAKLLAMDVPAAKIRLLPLGPGPLLPEDQATAARSSEATALASLPVGLSGQDPRVRAVRLASQHRPDLHLSVPLEESQGSSLLRQSSAIIFPESGGWPGLTPLAAQAAGCIPLVPDSHPLSETVVGGVTGIILPSYTAADMALALLRLHDDSQGLQRMREAAVKHALSTDANATARAFEAAIREAGAHRIAASV